MAEYEPSSSIQDDMESTVRLNPVQKYFMGDIKVLNDWMASKNIILQIPNWFFRAVGAPIFLNNPISGVIIVTGMYVANPWIAFNGTVGLLLAILMSLFLKQPKPDIICGGVTFHGMLVGIVIAASLNTMDIYPWSLLAILVMSPISVYIASGLCSIFSVWNLPVFNLPFNVTAFAFLAACRYHDYAGTNPHVPMKPDNPPAIGDQFVDHTFEWDRAFLAIPLSVAQVYGSSNVICGVLVLVAMLVASPIVLIHAVTGAFFSVLTAAAIAAPPEQIYTGEWAFNAMLTSASLGGFFWVLTPQSHILAHFAAIFATLGFGAAKTMLAPARLSPMAFPFVFTASLFLALSSGSKHLRRVPLSQVSYPEMHLRLFKSQNVGVSSPA